MLRIFLMVLFAMSFSQPFKGKDPRDIIEKVRIYRLTEELDLTEEQAVKFFTRLKELRKIEKDYHKTKAEILIELRNLLKSGGDDDEILAVIKKYEDLNKEKSIGQKKQFEEIKKILTPTQQASYLIFQDEFEREIREMIKEVRRCHSKP